MKGAFLIAILLTQMSAFAAEPKKDDPFNLDDISLDDIDLSGIDINVKKDSKKGPKKNNSTNTKQNSDDFSLDVSDIDLGDIELGSTDETKNNEKVCSYENIISSIEDDLTKFSPTESKTKRYISLYHLTCQGLKDRTMEGYRAAVIKLLNSLSWNKELINPEFIDKDKSILRFDLKHFHQIVSSKRVRRWSSTSIWDTLVRSEPYNVLVQPSLISEIKKKTDNEFPFIRGDWFITFASRTPLYEHILGIEGTQQKIEKLLEVDIAENIEKGTAVRAGFETSGVSAHNRVIERHETKFGAYWLSYDFIGSSGRKNIYTYPVGPKLEGHTPQVKDLNNKLFDFDGGEFIFNLPNGLQAYFLSDHRGRQLDKGPIDVVSDPNQFDRKVHNANSCFGCHSGGIIEATDYIRESVLDNSNQFTQNQINYVKSLYKPSEIIYGLMKQDQQVFQDALDYLGLTTKDTVRSHSLIYQNNVNQAQLASELGISTLRMKEIALHSSFRKILAPLVNPQSKIKRESFHAFFTSKNRRTLLKLIELINLPTDEDPYGSKTMNPKIESAMRYVRNICPETHTSSKVTQDLRCIANGINDLVRNNGEFFQILELKLNQQEENVLMSLGRSCLGLNDRNNQLKCLRNVITHTQTIPLNTRLISTVCTDLVKDNEQENCKQNALDELNI